MIKSLVLLIAVLGLATTVRAAEEVRLECVQDNSIVLHEDELNLNAGRQGTIRIKGNQHIVVMSFDMEPIRGRRVLSAKLVCTRVKESIEGVTISTISAPFDEMKSNALTSGMQEHEGWAWPGARFPAVTGSNAFSLVCQARTVFLEGRYIWEVAPELIQALEVDAAFGLAIHEWSSDYTRNPTIRSRENAAELRPHLFVVVDGKPERPDPPRNLALTDRRDPDSLRLELLAPRAGCSYEIMVNGDPLPRWNIPFVQPGERQVIPIRDLGLPPGAPLRLEVATLAATCRRSKSASIKGHVPPAAPVPLPDIDPPATSAPMAPTLFVLPETDKVDADGRPIGELPKDLLSGNGVCNGETIRLVGARGEVLGFNLFITGKGAVDLSCKLPGLRTEIALGRPVRVGERKIADPLLPPGRIALHPERPTLVSVDVYVPFEEKRRVIRGEIRLSDNRAVPIEVRVRDFSLPRAASFLMEMNSYGLPNSVATYAAMQDLAADHRVHLNILHYSHRTAAAGARKCTLDMRMANGRRMDEKRYNDIEPGDKAGYWDDFAEVFGPFLTGRHFAGSHRGAIPLPGFYLTFHESWPLNMMPYFNGNPDACEGFRDHPEYAATFTALLRDFQHRAKREGWAGAGFQVYLNNKHQPNRPKETSPWTLDEPTAYFDYRALAYYADLVAQAKENAPDVEVRFRIDISRPQFDRGELWGKADLWVVNGKSFEIYPRLLADRREFSGEEMWVYGQSSGVGESNRTLMAWALSAYRGSARGLVPWQTVSKDGKALEVGDPLGIFILDPSAGGEPAVLPSLRLKAFRRAEQDIEYLELLRGKLSLSDGQLRGFIDHYLTPDRIWAPEDYRRLREAAAVLIER